MFVSKNHGAQLYDRMRRAMRECYIFNCLYAAGATVLFWIFAEPMMCFITGSTNELVIGNGVRYLRFAAPFYLMLGMLSQ